MSLWKRRENIVSRENLLRSRPVRNLAVDWENQGKTIRVKIPRGNSWRARLLSFLFFVPKERVVELDELGTEIVRLCDSKRTVAQLSEHLARTRKLNRREAEVAILRYLQLLVKRGILGLAVPGKKGKGKTHG